jgi:FAD/FMN-containing dehydrogenase
MERLQVSRGDLRAEVLIVLPHMASAWTMMTADVLTADGSLIHTDETENSDLIWGLRGGAGNFGVVTSFEFKFCGPAYPEERGIEVYGI